MNLEQQPLQAVSVDAPVLRWFLGCVAFLVAFCLAAPAARAASEASRERAAKTACLAGDVGKGVGILAELYVRTNDPVFIFNQGRCFEQNGRYEDAIIRFREFLLKNQDAANPSDPETEKHIANCQALLDAHRQRDKQAAPAPGPVATGQANAPSAPPVAAGPVVTVTATPAQPVAASAAAAAQTAEGMSPAPEASTATSQPELVQAASSTQGSGLRIAGIAVVAVGVAGIATGIVLNVKANSLASEIESDRPYLRSRESTRASYATWGWVGYGAGGACLAGGAILYYLGYAQGRDSQMALAPTVGTGAFGAVVQGAF